MIKSSLHFMPMVVSLSPTVTILHLWGTRINILYNKNFTPFYSMWKYWWEKKPDQHLDVLTIDSYRSCHVWNINGKNINIELNYSFIPTLQSIIHKIHKYYQFTCKFKKFHYQISIFIMIIISIIIILHR